ncbi:MAG: aminoglycoside phosphotransferase family protein [Deltaproteobacteria bacterium]|nr:aminoglycoside phosphotransferase family protein [Deltaproteobacteria bacterium]
MAIIEQLRRILPLFQIDGQLRSIERHQGGHINDTFISEWIQAGAVKHYIHQRINSTVFTDIAAVMQNIALVTSALQSRIPELALSQNDRTLSLIPARDGSHTVDGGESGVWRSYVKIENAHSFDLCPSNSHAFEAAALLGRFHRYVDCIDASVLKETIPNFFSSPYRYTQLDEAIRSDKLKRRANAATEIEFAFQRREFANLVEKHRTAKEIPLKTVHGDMKLNNVLFESSTGRAVCLVDLDTCMAGFLLFDFGDLARNVSIRSAEDEPDLSRIKVDMAYFKATVKGYLLHAKPLLNELELGLIHLVPRLLANTLAVRFLTDYLEGDRYFRIASSDHNLQRARAQFAVVKAMENAETEMKQCVLTELR